MGRQAELNLEEWWWIRTVTDMVKLRKLTMGLHCHFPPP